MIFTGNQAVPDALAPHQWAITDAGTGGDASVTITALPASNGPAIQVIQYSSDGVNFGPILGGANQPGTYVIENAFTDGVPTDVWLRAVNANGGGPGNGPKSVTTSAGGATAPTATSVTPGVQGPDGTLSLDIAGITADAPDSSLVFTTTAQPSITTTQVRAGTDSADAAADFASIANLTISSFPVTVDLPSGLNGTYHGNIVFGANGAYSSPLAFAATFDIDTVIPGLTLGSGTTTDATSATWDVTTDKAGGTIYAVAFEGATVPTASQIIDGSGSDIVAAASAVVSATGVQSGSFTGLNESTLHGTAFVQVSATGTQSAVFEGTGFTTDAAAPSNFLNVLSAAAMPDVANPTQDIDNSANPAGTRIIAIYGGGHVASAVTFAGNAMTPVAGAFRNGNTRLQAFEFVTTALGTASDTIAVTQGANYWHQLIVIATNMTVTDAAEAGGGTCRPP